MGRPAFFGASGTLGAFGSKGGYTLSTDINEIKTHRHIFKKAHFMLKKKFNIVNKIQDRTKLRQKRKNK